MATNENFLFSPEISTPSNPTISNPTPSLKTSSLYNKEQKLIPTIPENISFFDLPLNIKNLNIAKKFQNFTLAFQQNSLELAFLPTNDLSQLKDWLKKPRETADPTEGLFLNSNTLDVGANNNTATELLLSDLITWSQNTILKNQSDSDPQSLLTLENEPTIRSITLNVNQICNLHCSYCAAGGDGSYGDPIKSISIERTLPQMKWMLSKLKDNQTFHINFLGGEPLLHPKSIELICQYLSELVEIQKNKGLNINVQFSITTNGTLITAEIAEMFAKYNFNISVSIDGPSEINDVVRPLKTKFSNFSGSTQKVIDGLNHLKLLKSKLGYIKLVGTFGTHNLELLKAYRFYDQFSFIDLMVFQLDHNNTDDHLSQIFTEEFLKVAEIAFSEKGENGLRRLEYFDRLFDKLDHQRPSLNYCGAGKTYAMVDSNNRLFSCPWDVNDKDLQLGVGTYFSKEKTAQYQKNQVEKPDCQSCWAKYLCGGGCSYIHKTSGFQTSKSFCNKERSLIKIGLMYYLLARGDFYES